MLGRLGSLLLQMHHLECWLAVEIYPQLSLGTPWRAAAHRGNLRCLIGSVVHTALLHSD